MAEKRLQAAIDRERKRITRLAEERDREVDRGFRQSLNHRIRKAKTVKEALEYALALIRGEEEE